MIRIEVPGDPVGKGRPRAFRMGAGIRMHTDEKTRSYCDRLSDYAGVAMQGRDIIAGPVAVTIIAEFTMPRSLHRKREPRPPMRKATKPDLDNLVKQLDALNGIVWVDDSQVVQLTAQKWHAAQGRGGRLVVIVEPIE